MTFGTVQIVSVTIVHNKILGSRFHSKDFAPMRYSVSQLPSTKNVQNGGSAQSRKRGKAAAQPQLQVPGMYQEVRDRELCSQSTV